MKRWSFPTVSAAAATAAAAVVFFLSATAVEAVVEHTFVVSQMNMTRLCKETPVAVVNGQLPGPVIEVTEGDSVVVHVVNKSPYNITIHWAWREAAAELLGRRGADDYPVPHSAKQQLHLPVRRRRTGRHPVLACSRRRSPGTLHGALIIRPRHSYPFTKPHREIPIVIGDWWQMDLEQVDRDFKAGYIYNEPVAPTMNGKIGDLYNCSGAMEDGYVLDVEPGKTYLLRVINAALFHEYYLKIAGHNFTVVAADASYVSPYPTDVIAVAPGETVDALLVADATPGRYYMVAQGIQSPLPERQMPDFATRGIVQYSNGAAELSGVPLAPEMPNQHDTMTSFYFHGNLTMLRRRGHAAPPVPTRVDERLFVTLSLGSICHQGQSCKRSGSNESIIVATMNNVSFQNPAATTTPPLLEAYYYHTGGSLDALQQLPDRPPVAFNFTDPAFVPYGGPRRRCWSRRPRLRWRGGSDTVPWWRWCSRARR
ncbi:hypothetical protein ACP70R_019841 [Stipagrostis hirtigluma subsp. patula]